MATQLSILMLMCRSSYSVVGFFLKSTHFICEMKIIRKKHFLFLSILWYVKHTFKFSQFFPSFFFFFYASTVKLVCVYSSTFTKKKRGKERKCAEKSFVMYSYIKVHTDTFAISLQLYIHKLRIINKWNSK